MWGRLAESTWQAFWQNAVEGKNDPQAVRELRMSVVAVYLIEGRVMARLKGIIRETLDASV